MRCAVFAVLGLLWTSADAQACLWDRDTLQMEKKRFPEAHELISGKFVRHSLAFYRWRIEDRKKRLEQTPDDLAVMDDLAVAYDKVGAHQEAIAVMERALALQPGRYESLANLGTFYVHSGSLKRGLAFIREAIKVNPDAHFGREKYQAYLVEYLMKARASGRAGLPILPVDQRNWPKDGGGRFRDSRGFFAFVMAKESVRLKDPNPSQRKNSGQVLQLRKKVLKGVLGMMRFGNFRSPVLLEALGDTLTFASPWHLDDAKRMAARAYLRASEEAKNEAAKKGYRALAERVLVLQQGKKLLPRIEKRLRRETQLAERFAMRIARDEARWIQSGKNVEKRFARKYFKGR